MNAKRLLDQLDGLTNETPIKPTKLEQVPIVLCEIMENNIKGKE